ncbi:MAG: hypothetical protein N3H84_08025, partial [Candidatus Caldarchaeum sp.]|nr:hypothetical protein [Candidatus Caldarchaeum sp.]
MVSEMLGARIHRKPDILTVLLFFLSAFLVANFLLFASFARLDVGVGSQWLYNVRVGGSAGLAVESYEEKVWLESLTYCEKILCYRIVKTNPTHLHSDYLTGDNRLLRSTIIDKGDGTVYEISYEPPLLMMPMSLSVGDVWQSSSTATVFFPMAQSEPTVSRILASPARFAPVGTLRPAGGLRRSRSST